MNSEETFRADPMGLAGVPKWKNFLFQDPFGLDPAVSPLIVSYIFEAIVHLCSCYFTRFSHVPLAWFGS